MSTDDKMKAYLKKYLSAEEYDALSLTARHSALPTFLLSMSNIKLSNNVLILIEQFLESLPIDEATQYVECTDIWGNTALLYGEVTFIKIILKYDTNIDARNWCGNNCLMRECSFTSGSPDIEKIKFLLDNGININAINFKNYSALMCYCATCESKGEDRETIESIIELLIFNGADVLIKSSTNMTAFDYITNKSLLSDKLSQLLHGLIRMNRTKRAS